MSDNQYSIRIKRGKLAMLHEATTPYNEEQCYITITSKYIQFSSLINQFLGFEHRINQAKYLDITNINAKKIKNMYLICSIDKLKKHLAPFSKPIGSESAKKSEENVLLDLEKNQIRFRQEFPQFIGDWISIEANNEELWHRLPQMDDTLSFNGQHFYGVVNRMSSTGESTIEIISKNDNLYMKSDAGIEYLTNKPGHLINISLHLPRIQLKRACNLIKQYHTFRVQIENEYILLEGVDKDKDNNIKILIYKVAKS